MRILRLCLALVLLPLALLGQSGANPWVYGFAEVPVNYNDGGPGGGSWTNIGTFTTAGGTFEIGVIAEWRGDNIRNVDTPNAPIASFCLVRNGTSETYIANLAPSMRNADRSWSVTGETLATPSGGAAGTLTIVSSLSAQITADGDGYTFARWTVTLPAGTYTQQAMRKFIQQYDSESGAQSEAVWAVGGGFLGGDPDRLQMVEASGVTILTGDDFPISNQGPDAKYLGFVSSRWNKSAHQPEVTILDGEEGDWNQQTLQPVTGSPGLYRLPDKPATPRLLHVRLKFLAGSIGPLSFSESLPVTVTVEAQQRDPMQQWLTVNGVDATSASLTLRDYTKTARGAIAGTFTNATPITLMASNLHGKVTGVFLEVRSPGGVVQPVSQTGTTLDARTGLTTKTYTFTPSVPGVHKVRVWGTADYAADISGDNSNAPIEYDLPIASRAPAATLTIRDAGNTTDLPLTAGSVQLQYMQQYSLRYSVTDPDGDLAGLRTAVANGATDGTATSLNPKAAQFSWVSGRGRYELTTPISLSGGTSAQIASITALTATTIGAVTITGEPYDATGISSTVTATPIVVGPANTSTTAASSSMVNLNTNSSVLTAAATRTHDGAPIAGATFTWAIANTAAETATGTVDANTGVLRVTSLGNGLIRVRATMAATSYYQSSSGTTVVTVNQAPVATGTFPTKLKSNESGAFTLSATDVNSNARYLILQYWTDFDTDTRVVRPLDTRDAGAPDTDALLSSTGTGTLGPVTRTWTPDRGSGRYTLQARAVDAMGLEGIQEYTLDLVPNPTVTMQVTAITAANGGPVTGRFASGVPIQSGRGPVYLNAGDTIAYTGTARGPYLHTLRVRYIDTLATTNTAYALTESTIAPNQTAALGSLSTSGTFTMPASGATPLWLFGFGASDAPGGSSNYAVTTGRPTTTEVGDPNLRIELRRNNAAVAPTPTGPATLWLGETGTYTFSASDADGNLASVVSTMSEPSPSVVTNATTHAASGGSFSTSRTLQPMSAGTWSVRTRALDALEPTAGGTTSSTLSVTVSNRPGMLQWLEYGTTNIDTEGNRSATSTRSAGWRAAPEAIYSTTDRGSIGNGVASQTYYIGQTILLRAVHSRTSGENTGVSMRITPPSGAAISVLSGETVVSAAERRRDYSLALTQVGTYRIEIWGTANYASPLSGDNSAAPVVYNLVVPNRLPTGSLSILTSGGSVLTPDASNQVTRQYGQSYSLRYSASDADGNLQGMTMRLASTAINAGNQGAVNPNTSTWAWNAAGYYTQATPITLTAAAGATVTRTFATQTALVPGLHDLTATVTDSAGGSATVSTPDLLVVPATTVLGISPSQSMAIVNQGMLLQAFVTRQHDGFRLTNPAISWTIVQDATHTATGTISGTGETGNMTVTSRGNGRLLVRASYAGNTNHSASSATCELGVNAPPEASASFFDANWNPIAPNASNQVVLQYAQTFGVRVDFSDLDPNLSELMGYLYTPVSDADADTQNPDATTWAWDSGLAGYTMWTDIYGVESPNFYDFADQRAQTVGAWHYSFDVMDIMGEEAIATPPELVVRPADVTVAISSSARARPRVPYQLTGSVTRTHDSYLLSDATLAWSIANTPAETATGTISGNSLTVSDPGNGLIRIRASYDGSYGHAAGETTKVISVNRLPVFSSATLTQSGGAQAVWPLATNSVPSVDSYARVLQVAVNATDPDGDSLTISNLVLQRLINGTPAQSIGERTLQPSWWVWDATNSGYTLGASRNLAFNQGAWNSPLIRSSTGPATWRVTFSISDGLDTTALSGWLSWTTGNLPPILQSVAVTKGEASYPVAEDGTLGVSIPSLSQISLTAVVIDPESESLSSTWSIATPSGLPLNAGAPSAPWAFQGSAYSSTGNLNALQTAWPVSIVLAAVGNWQNTLTVTDPYGASATRAFVIGTHRLQTVIDFPSTTRFVPGDAPPVTLGSVGALSASVRGASTIVPPTHSIVYSVAEGSPFGTPGTVVDNATLVDSGRTYLLSASLAADDFYDAATATSTLTLSTDVPVEVQIRALPQGKDSIFFTPSETHSDTIRFRRP